MKLTTSLFSDRLLVLLRLVVPRRHHVRDVNRVSAILLGKSPGDSQENHELEGDTRFPARGPHLRGSQRDHSKVIIFHGFSSFLCMHDGCLRDPFCFVFLVRIGYSILSVNIAYLSWQNLFLAYYQSHIR